MISLKRSIRLINLWPPFFWNGIKATHVSKDFRHIDVKLKLRWHNANYFGTQYGGHLFSMTDPWYMMMLLHNLGKNYYIWDKKATIDFISPGRSHVFAHFELTQEKIDEIITATNDGEKYLPEFVVDILDKDHKIVARVHRTVYIKRKPQSLDSTISPSS